MVWGWDKGDHGDRSLLTQGLSSLPTCLTYSIENDNFSEEITVFLNHGLLEKSIAFLYSSNE